MSESSESDERRALPAVTRLVDAVDLPGFAPGAVVVAARQVLDEARRLREAPELPVLTARVRSLLEADRAPALLRVLNGTGVLVHTNLGRAPLDREGLLAAVPSLAGYSDLEWNRTTGERGERGATCRRRLARLYGGEAALVVGNAAGGVLLALRALARGGEAIVSRGELVAIGGGFRIPDVLDLSGATLVEVGTTNRTTVGDVRAAIGPATRTILRAETSNFEQRGFVERPDLRELASLAKGAGIPLVVDLGHGSPDDLSAFGLSVTPVGAVLAAGAGLVVGSGDKLLGGPQAGILVGEAALVAKCARDPLYRALRAGGATYALLGATAGEWLAGRADSVIPLRRQLAATDSELLARGSAVVSALGPRADRVRIESSEATIGGGTTPGRTIPSRALTLHPADGDAEKLAEKLRSLDPPIATRTADGRVLVDLRSILPEEDALLVEGLSAVLRSAQDGASSSP